MLDFLLIMQRDLQMWFILRSSLIYLYHMIGSKESERKLEIIFARSFGKVEWYGDINCLKVLLKGTALTTQTKFHRSIQHQGALTSSLAMIQGRSLNYQNTARTSNLLTMNLQSFHLLLKKCWLAMYQPSLKRVVMVNFLGWRRLEMR